MIKDYLYTLLKTVLFSKKRKMNHILVRINTEDTRINHIPNLPNRH